MPIFQREQNMNSVGAPIAVALFCVLVNSAAQAGKPEELSPNQVEISGFENQGGPVESFEVERQSKRGETTVQVVVRDMLFSSPVAMSELDGGETCFGDGGVPDETYTAGSLNLFSDGSAELDIYPQFRTVEGDLQSNNFFFSGDHNVDLQADPVVGVVWLDNLTVDTEGRGKKPKSCRGVIPLDDTSVHLDPA